MARVVLVQVVELVFDCKDLKLDLSVVDIAFVAAVE